MYNAHTHALLIHNQTTRPQVNKSHIHTRKPYGCINTHHTHTTHTIQIRYRRDSRTWETSRGDVTDGFFIFSLVVCERESDDTLKTFLNLLPCFRKHIFTHKHTYTHACSRTIQHTIYALTIIDRSSSSSSLCHLSPTIYQITLDFSLTVITNF